MQRGAAANAFFLSVSGLASVTVTVCVRMVRVSVQSERGMSVLCLWCCGAFRCGRVQRVYKVTDVAFRSGNVLIEFILIDIYFFLKCQSTRKLHFHFLINFCTFLSFLHTYSDTENTRELAKRDNNLNAKHCPHTLKQQCEWSVLTSLIFNYWHYFFNRFSSLANAWR